MSEVEAGEGHTLPGEPILSDTVKTMNIKVRMTENKKVAVQINFQRRVSHLARVRAAHCECSRQPECFEAK